MRDVVLEHCLSDVHIGLDNLVACPLRLPMVVQPVVRALMILEGARRLLKGVGGGRLLLLVGGA